MLRSTCTDISFFALVAASRLQSSLSWANSRRVGPTVVADHAVTVLPAAFPFFPSAGTTF